MRLENGLEKLKGTSSQVEDLKAKLAAQEQELAVKNDEANKLIQVVGAETEKVNLMSLEFWRFSIHLAELKDCSQSVIGDYSVSARHVSPHLLLG